jgi:hypothetical protein
MTKTIAKIGVFSAQVGVMFLNYWFTFGLWPKSWASFFGCGFAGVVLIALNIAIDKDTK